MASLTCHGDGGTKQVRLERIVRPVNRGVQVGRLGFFRILGLELPGPALNMFGARSRERVGTREHCRVRSAGVPS